eukprot:TRINITY_DN2510_c0_g1_i1.p1 TRINITY_DN2510_c0_g1~~TRINITY_DN2510_c0_g1_i1.p1  ORF type:complete len:637 (+),score=90.39 TRINITY_DN2510_c0_g1_i1:26-1936(+)
MKETIILLLTLTLLLCESECTSNGIYQTLQNECGNSVLTETQFENRIVFDLHFTSKYILLISNYRLYRSENDGATWEPFLFNSTTRVADIAVGSNPDFLVITGQQNHMFVSFDGGDTFHERFSPGSRPLGNIQINPLNNSWIMGRYVEGDCRRTDGDCAFFLYLTNDYGVTWRRLRTYIWMYYFAGDIDHPNRVVLWEDTVKERDQREASESVISVSVEPFYLQFKSVVRNATGFLKVDDKIFAARPLDEGLGLYVSNDNGDSFRIAKTPSKLKGSRFTILDATPGSVFVNAEDHSNTGKIYVSNEEGDDFSLSLVANPRSRYGVCDFSRVDPIQGVYLANTLYGQDYITVITFSEGGSWERLRVNDCSIPPCYLNLFGNKDGRSLWYSNKEVPGFIIANGNIGEKLSSHIRDMNTFVSFDAGKSWNFLKSGLHKYTFDDTGSILVLAETSSSTNEISYSFDMGKTIHTCTLPGQGNVRISAIIPVPGKKKFILFGTRSTHEIAISLDLSRNSIRGCSSTDFEYWRTDDCVNGRKNTYRRRKRESICVSSQENSKPIQTENCVCTENDYQCTYCHRWSDQGECVIDYVECPNYNPNQQPPSCHGYWYKTSGYRIIPGDSCITSGGVNHEDTKVPCH